MEQGMDDGLFWLPAEFLNDVDFNSGKTGVSLNSGISSPVESVVDSIETESDEEDYLNELSRKLAQSTLEDNFWKMETSHHNSKSTSVMARSPQSTLCGYKETPNRVSPAPPVNQTETAWDLLYAAAGEVARLRKAEEGVCNYSNPNLNQIAPQPPRRIPSPTIQLQAAQFKQQQQQQQQFQQFMPPTRGRPAGGNTKPAALPLTAWPTLQQSQQQPQPGSGMRAVFLGNQTTKRECTGTGVFLPRQIGAPIEPQKKRGCSTVLLPERVLHALNLNLEAQKGSNGGRPSHDYDAEMRHQRSVLMAEQRRRQVEKDLRLPQEWTY